MNDLGGIEPPKSFRNAGDSVPYGTLKKCAKVKLIYTNNRGGRWALPGVCFYTRFPMASASSWASSRSEIMVLDIKKPSGVSR